MHAKLIDIANCKTRKNILLVDKNTILIRYYKQTAETRASYESIDVPAENPPNSDGLGVYDWTILELTVPVDWHPGLQIGQRFGLDLCRDPKWQSATVANTYQNQISDHC